MISFCIRSLECRYPTKQIDFEQNWNLWKLGIAEPVVCSITLRNVNPWSASWKIIAAMKSRLSKSNLWAHTQTLLSCSSSSSLPPLPPSPTKKKKKRETLTTVCSKGQILTFQANLLEHNYGRELLIICQHWLLMLVLSRCACFSFYGAKWNIKHRFGNCSFHKSNLDFLSSHF